MSTIKFSQSSNSILVNFDFANESNVKQIVGTSCNELFELIDLQSTNVINLFKLSQPIDVCIDGETFNIDTAKLSIQLRTKLKLNKSADAKRRFAKRVFALTEYALRERKTLTDKQAIELFS